MAEPIADIIAVSVTVIMFIIQFRKILKSTAPGDFNNYPV